MENFKTAAWKDGKRSGCNTAGLEINQVKEKSNIFNHFFVPCAKNLTSACRTTGQSFYKWLPQRDPELGIFNFQNFTVLETLKALRELKAKKATGDDGIPSRLLKDGDDALADPLTI